MCRLSARKSCLGSRVPITSFGQHLFFCGATNIWVRSCTGLSRYAPMQYRAVVFVVVCECGLSHAMPAFTCESIENLAMRYFLKFVMLATVLGVGFTKSSASAQTTAEAQFCITVSEALGIVGPSAPIAIFHDGSGNSNAFPAVSWTCICNDADGSVATFSTLTGMVHSAVPTSMRDVQLNLAVTSADAGSGWATTIASDQTDVTAVVPDLIATVQAESTGPGDATLDLTVTFITDDFATLVPGIYCTTVVATITAK